MSRASSKNIVIAIISVLGAFAGHEAFACGSNTSLKEALNRLQPLCCENVADVEAGLSASRFLDFQLDSIPTLHSTQLEIFEQSCCLTEASQTYREKPRYSFRTGLSPPKSSFQ